MKRITLSMHVDDRGVETLWRADSKHYGVSAYGRNPSEAKSRLFLTTQAHRRNLYAAVSCHPGL